MKWDNYVMKSGPRHDQFWRDYLLEKRDVLYVVANGFDPRMCDGAESIAKQGGNGKRDCRLVKLGGTSNSTAVSYGGLVDGNTRKLERVFDKWQIQTIDLALASNRDMDAQREAVNVVNDDDYSTYTDIIVDISAMPTRIFFPLLSGALRRLSGRGLLSGRSPNLFVVVSDDTSIDRTISKMGLDEEANFVHSFLGDMGLQANELGPSVWIPVLGENRAGELDRLHRMINPAETCPVLPSPSGDPRRGDTLLLEYRDMLRKLGIDPRNMIYASESNPFDVYRQIHDAIVHYDQVLKPLKIYRFAISPLSSKLMSVGVFLAAYELTYEKGIKPGIGIVGAAGYKFDEPDVEREANLFTVWMHGDCYEP